MSRLKDKYKKDVIPALQKEFGYKNVMAVPRVQKVVVNLITAAGSSQQPLEGTATRVDVQQ